MGNHRLAWWYGTRHFVNFDCQRRNCLQFPNPELPDELIWRCNHSTDECCRPGHCTVCVITEESSFSCKRNWPKGTTQMKALAGVSSKGIVFIIRDESSVCLQCFVCSFNLDRETIIFIIDFTPKTNVAMGVWSFLVENQGYIQSILSSFDSIEWYMKKMVYEEKKYFS